MIRCDSFARAALFAAVAAAGWLAWAVAAWPVLGVRSALGIYLAAVAALYVGGLSAQRERRVAIMLGAVVLIAALALVARTTTELVIGLAATIGIARSAFVYRAAPTRAVVTEVVLLGGGLLFARALAGTSLASIALALWGFLLVQSLFFLVGGVRPRSLTASSSDPFEEAHNRVIALLERTGM